MGWWAERPQRQKRLTRRGEKAGGRRYFDGQDANDPRGDLQKDRGDSQSIYQKLNDESAKS